ncbi:MAG: DUF3179 domain-containing (seleno)protein, partial [Pseudomonadota bacterium]
MSLTRRGFAGLTAAAALTPHAVWAQEDPILNALRMPLFGSNEEFNDAMRLLQERGNPDVVAGLLSSLRFSRSREPDVARVMEALTGETHGTDWFDWMLWQERHAEIAPHPSLIALKREILLGIDPNFDLFLRPEYLTRERMKIRLEEITWGGVRKDGIPSLDNPDLIGVSEASYLRDSDLVFGVEINGDVRAYPLRIMGWHEMFNEVIGDVPVALAYCTLCGSG